MEDSRETTRERSPNYPAFPLPGAIEFVRRVYEAEKRSPVPAIIIGQALSGNTTGGLSGPSRSKIAAMRQYSLLEEVSKGRLRVSDRALAIIQRPSAGVYAMAVRECAFAPPLFADLNENHLDASDSAIRYHLMTTLGFTEDGANRVIKSYRETVGFANLEAPSYNAETEPNDFSTKAGETAFKTSIMEHGSPRGGLTSGGQLERGVSQMAYTWPLPDGVVAQVALLGNKPTERAIERLITFLSFMRDDLRLSESSDLASRIASLADPDGSTEDP